MPYVNDTGFPSFSDIMRPWVDTRWFLPEHSERGTAVHAACHAILVGRFALKLRPEWEGYVDSFRGWLAGIGMEQLLLCERRLIDAENGYCGQPDLICRLRGERKPVLIDLKTSGAEQWWWEYQVAAYRHLAKINGIETGRGFSLRLKRNGKLPTAYSYEGYHRRLNTFFAAVIAYRAFGGHKGADNGICTERQN